MTANATVAVTATAPPKGLRPISAPKWKDWSTPTLVSLFRSKLFWCFFLLKLSMGALLASYFMRDLFAPFINYFVESHFSNPWTYFASLGRLNSFPYPPVMLYIMAFPRLLFGWLLPAGTGVVSWKHLLVLRLPLLAADTAIAVILALWFPGRQKRILMYYWCSPLVLYVCYWHGQLDIIPTALFVVALHLILRHRISTAMVVLGLSLAAKTHLFVALPFLFLYLLQELGAAKAIRAALIASATFTLCLMPFVLSTAFRLMVFGTQEQGRLIAMRFPVGPQMSVLLAPAAIVLLWFRFLAYRHRNWDLLMLYLGILFSVFVLFAPPAPGYVLWSLPFLLHFLCRSRGKDGIPLWTYCGAYLVFFLTYKGSDLFDAWRTVMPSFASRATPYELMLALDPNLAQTMESISFTVLQASLLGIILFMYLMGVKRNDAHNARNSPIMIGVAGDSGAGKDRFVRLLADAIGHERVAVIAGDDYHRWPRGHEKWREFTHLDLRANHLHKQYEHAVMFSSGQPVLKSTYDHHTGRSTENEFRDPNDVMIFQGLHSLAIDALRRMYDLSIFLDPDESLRYRWKIERDGRERGYTPEQVRKSLQDRQRDREDFILPQVHDAELVIRWMPSQDDDSDSITLEIMASNSFNLEDVAAELTRFPTLSVRHEYCTGRKQALTLAGVISADLLANLVPIVITDNYKYLTRPVFSSGLEGCLQLVICACLSQKLFWKQSR